MKELSSDNSSSDYIDFDMKFATSQSPVDVESVTWRQETTKLTIGSKNSQDNKDPKEIVSDDESE